MNTSISELLVISGLILILLELLAGVQAGFDFVLIGGSLILGGLSGILTSNIFVSIFVAAILNVAYILFGRKLVKKQLLVITKHTNIDKLLNKTAVVIRAITPDTAGMVRLDDEDWRAISDTVVYEKDKVKVVGVEGVALKVTKV